MLQLTLKGTVFSRDFVAVYRFYAAYLRLSIHFKAIYHFKEITTTTLSPIVDHQVSADVYEKPLVRRLHYN